MISRTLILALAALAACTAGDDTAATDTDSTDADTGTTDTGDTDTGPAAGHTHAVLTTVSSDYTTGSFATIALDDWTIADELFVTTGDAAVSVDGGKVFQINRLGYDTARMYSPGEWTAPQWEKELADGSNPGAADICRGKLFVALYGTDTLGVYDPNTGNQTGTVDLSQFDDGDSVGPEPASLVELGGKLYVGMNRLDRDNSWADAGGMVAEVDCTTSAVTNSWSVGGNATVRPWSGTELLVLAKAYGSDEGGIYALDPASGVRHIAAVSGETMTGIAASGDRAIAISAADDYSHYALHCIDLAGETVLSSANTMAYYSGIAANDRGEAWVIAGSSWLDATAPVGVSVFDIATCDELTTSPLALSLAPKDIAFY